MSKVEALDLTMPSGLLEPTDPVERERLLQEAEAEIAATGGTPHEAVRAWLLQLAEGRFVPPPCDQ